MNTDDLRRLDPGAVARRAQALGALHRPNADTIDADDEDVLDNLGDQLAQGMAERRTALWQVLIPSRLQWATVADFAGDVAEPLGEWAAGPAGRNLCLFGPVGVGKSHAAVAAVRPLHERGMGVRFLPVVELLDLLRPGGPEGMFTSLSDVDVLVLDDLGTERATDWTAERLYAVVNRRWLEERPTVVTTNLEPARLEESIGPRAYSRLVGSGAVNVRLTGNDRRRSR